MRYAHFLIALLSVAYSQPSLLNGSFETGPSGCLYNIPNATFNDNVSNCTGFGTASQLDIISSACGFGTAQSGTWYIALAVDITNTLFDGFSMTLSSPLTAGSDYTLTFFDRKHASYNSNTFQIGVSTVPGLFGTSVATFAAPGLGWNARSVTFTAPVSGSYITIQVIPGTYGWNHVDNFVITPAVLDAKSLELSFSSGGVYPHFTWRSDLEQEDGQFMLQRSTDGQTWYALNLQHAFPGKAYQYADSLPEPGLNLYRLCFVSPDGVHRYSEIISFASSSQSPVWQVYPNPATDQISLIRSNGGSSAEAHFYIYNATGTLVAERAGNIAGSWDISGLPPGVYMIEILADGVYQTQSIVIE